jgi:hypothetical protein
LTAGCDGTITQRVERDWQDTHRLALAPGYSEFRGRDISVDVGVAIFSYRLHDASENVLDLIANRIQTNEPCYRVFLRSTNEMRLRCPTRTFGFEGFDEYAIRWHGPAELVTVMWGNFDSETEVGQQYAYFEESFRRLADDPKAKAGWW